MSSRGCGHIPRPGTCGGCQLTLDDDARISLAAASLHTSFYSPTERAARLASQALRAHAHVVRDAFPALTSGEPSDAHRSALALAALVLALSEPSA